MTSQKYSNSHCATRFEKRECKTILYLGSLGDNHTIVK